MFGDAFASTAFCVEGVSWEVESISDDALASVWIFDAEVFVGSDPRGDGWEGDSPSFGAAPEGDSSDVVGSVVITGSAKTKSLSVVFRWDIKSPVFDRWGVFERNLKRVNLDKDGSGVEMNFVSIVSHDAGFINHVVKHSIDFDHKVSVDNVNNTLSVDLEVFDSKSIFILFFKVGEFNLDFVVVVSTGVIRQGVFAVFKSDAVVFVNQVGVKTAQAQKFFMVHTTAGTVTYPAVAAFISITSSNECWFSSVGAGWFFVITWVGWAIVVKLITDTEASMAGVKSVALSWVVQSTFMSATAFDLEVYKAATISFSLFSLDMFVVFTIVFWDADVDVGWDGTKSNIVVTFRVGTAVFGILFNPHWGSCTVSGMSWVADHWARSFSQVAASSVTPARQGWATFTLNIFADWLVAVVGADSGFKLVRATAWEWVTADLSNQRRFGNLEAFTFVASISPCSTNEVGVTVVSSACWGIFATAFSAASFLGESRFSRWHDVVTSFFARSSSDSASKPIITLLPSEFTLTSLTSFSPDIQMVFKSEYSLTWAEVAFYPFKTVTE